MCGRRLCTIHSRTWLHYRLYGTVALVFALSDGKSYLTGLADPAQGSLGFNLDTENESHLKMIEWAEDKKDGLQFYLGSSESTAAPTATGGVVTLPATRSWWSFKGGISTPVPSFEADALVGYTVTLERETTVAFTPKT